MLAGHQTDATNRSTVWSIGYGTSAMESFCWHIKLCGAVASWTSAVGVLLVASQPAQPTIWTGEEG